MLFSQPKIWKKIAVPKIWKERLLEFIFLDSHYALCWKWIKKERPPFRDLILVTFLSTVGSLLSSLSFTPTKRYEEVDGVRKEKERLTTDHPLLRFNVKNLADNDRDINGILVILSSFSVFFPGSQGTLIRRRPTKRMKPLWATVSEQKEKERCSGSYRLAVGFLVIKDESISQRPG